MTDVYASMEVCSLCVCAVDMDTGHRAQVLLDGAFNLP